MRKLSVKRGMKGSDAEYFTSEHDVSALSVVQQKNVKEKTTQQYASFIHLYFISYYSTVW